MDKISQSPQGLAGKDRLSKSGFHSLYCGWVAVTKLVHNLFDSDAEGAKAMQNGLVKAAQFGKVWINVQWVGVS